MCDWKTALQRFQTTATFVCYHKLIVVNTPGCGFWLRRVARRTPHVTSSRKLAIYYLPVTFVLILSGPRLSQSRESLLGSLWHLNLKKVVSIEKLLSALTLFAVQIKGG